MEDELTKHKKKKPKWKRWLIEAKLSFNNWYKYSSYEKYRDAFIALDNLNRKPALYGEHIQYRLIDKEKIHKSK